MSEPSEPPGLATNSQGFSGFDDLLGPNFDSQPNVSNAPYPKRANINLSFLGDDYDIHSAESFGSRTELHNSNSNFLNSFSLNSTNARSDAFGLSSESDSSNFGVSLGLGLGRPQSTPLFASWNGQNSSNQIGSAFPTQSGAGISALNSNGTSGNNFFGIDPGSFPKQRSRPSSTEISGFSNNLQQMQQHVATQQFQQGQSNHFGLQNQTQQQQLLAHQQQLQLAQLKQQQQQQQQQQQSQQLYCPQPQYQNQYRLPTPPLGATSSNTSSSASSSTLPAMFQNHMTALDRKLDVRRGKGGNSNSGLNWNMAELTPTQQQQLLRQHHQMQSQAVINHFNQLAQLQQQQQHQVNRSIPPRPSTTTPSMEYGFSRAHTSQTLKSPSPGKNLLKLEDSAVEEVVARTCREILIEAANHTLKAVELANTLRARVGTEVLAFVRERWGGLLSLLERHQMVFRVERIPKNDLVTLIQGGRLIDEIEINGMGSGIFSTSTPDLQQQLGSSMLGPNLSISTSSGTSTPGVMVGGVLSAASPVPEGQPSRCLHVGNVPTHLTESQLMTEFQQYGELDSLKLVTQRNRRFAFVSYKTVEQAMAAKQKMSKLHAWKSAISFAHKESYSGSTSNTASPGANASTANMSIGQSVSAYLEKQQQQQQQLLQQQQYQNNQLQQQRLLQLQRQQFGLHQQQPGQPRLLQRPNSMSSLLENSELTPNPILKMPGSSAHSSSLTGGGNSSMAYNRSTSAGNLANQVKSVAPSMKFDPLVHQRYAEGSKGENDDEPFNMSSVGGDFSLESFENLALGELEDEDEGMADFVNDALALSSPYGNTFNAQNDNFTSSDLNYNAGRSILESYSNPVSPSKQLSGGIASLQNFGEDESLFYSPYGRPGNNSGSPGLFGLMASPVRPTSGLENLGLTGSLLNSDGINAGVNNSNNNPSGLSTLNKVIGRTPSPGILSPSNFSNGNSIFGGLNDSNNQLSPSQRIGSNFESSLSFSECGTGTGTSSASLGDASSSSLGNSYSEERSNVLRLLCDDTYVPTQKWPADPRADAPFCHAVAIQLRQFGGSTTISKLRGFLRTRLAAPDNVKSVPLKALLGAYPQLFTVSGSQVTLNLGSGIAASPRQSSIPSNNNAENSITSNYSNSTNDSHQGNNVSSKILADFALQQHDTQ